MAASQADDELPKKLEQTTLSSSPKLEDLSAENLTQHVINISSNISNERVKFIFSKLIQHAHDFVREVDLQRDEWEASWQFLTDVSIQYTHSVPLAWNREIVFSDMFSVKFP
jgi:hypothetical protein